VCYAGGFLVFFSRFSSIFYNFLKIANVLRSVTNLNMQFVSTFICGFLKSLPEASLKKIADK